VQIERGAPRAGVAALCADELRFHTGRTGREGQDFFVHIRFDEIVSLVADGAAGTLTVATDDQGAVIFHLGRLATAWKQIIEDRPDLLRDLGVTARSRVALVGVDDDALCQALAARVPGFADGAADAGRLDVLFLGAEHRADLARLAAAAGRVRRGGVIWVVYPVTSRAVTGAEIVAAGGAAGLLAGDEVALSPERVAQKLMRLGT
jgi:hypothetical protein